MAPRTRNPGRLERHTVTLPAATWRLIREAARSTGIPTRDLMQQAGQQIAERYLAWVDGRGTGWTRPRRPTEEMTEDQYKARARARDGQPAWPPQRQGTAVIAGPAPHPHDAEDIVEREFERLRSKGRPKDEP